MTAARDFKRDRPGIARAVAEKLEEVVVGRTVARGPRFAAVKTPTVAVSPLPVCAFAKIR